MIYFTKYLPSPDQPDSQEKYNAIPHGEIVACYGADGDGPVSYIPFTGNELGIQRVKLFLCSRDIQVGDNCYSIPRNHYFKADFQTLKALKNDEIGIVKIIGEVSPEVGERELTEEQFALMGTDASGILCQITEEDLKNGWSLTRIEVRKRWP